jgi:hypothetical protein
MGKRARKVSVKPEAGVGKHVAGKHLAGVGAVVHGVALGVYLIEVAGEEQGAVHVGIEGALGVE